MSTATEIATETTTKTTQLVPGAYQVDPVHSQVGFEVKHLGVSTFRGGFNGFEGTVEVGPTGPQSIHGKIDVGSVSVPEEKLIGHLLSPDFFDAEQYPEIAFSSTSIEPAGDGDADRYRVRGDLTMRGVTRPVELDLIVEGSGTGMTGSDLLALSAGGEVDRTEYGISWSNNLETGVAIVSEKVRLVLQVEAQREN